jgi:hypothetical protein
MFIGFLPDPRVLPIDIRIGVAALPKRKRAFAAGPDRIAKARRRQ